MHTFQLFIFLAAVSIVLVSVATKIKVPYPLTLIIGGALLSFIPGLTHTSFDPDLLLVVVLPPLLHYSAIWISFRDFKKNIKDIFSLALGLVLITTLVVGIFFKWLFPDVPWALAFMFGAIVSPPDAVSATTILKRFNIDHDLRNVIEGESLINDAAALVIYKMSVIALLTGAFSLHEASLQFTKIAFGGLLYGAAVGYCLQLFIKRFLKPIMAVMFSFPLPYIVYISAMAFDMSGVLAVVASGLVTSWFLTKHYDSYRRILSVPIWSIFIILLNCLVFMLIGLQLRNITVVLSNHELWLYSGYAVATTCIMMLIRFIWVLTKPTFCFFKQCHDPVRRHFQERIILACCGMRGIISLACAMAIPYSVIAREVVIFITFEVILLTLVIPSFLLPKLLKWFQFHSRKDTDTVNAIRKKLIAESEKEISTLLHLDQTERDFLKNYIHTRHKVYELSDNGLKGSQLEEARRKLLQTQRKTLLDLWEKGDIDDVLVKNIELELDLEEQLTLRAEIH